MGLTGELVAEVVAATPAGVPAGAAARVRDAILDDVGIAFLGYWTAGDSVVRYALDAGRGMPEAPLAGDGTLVSCLVAAGANAQFANDTNFNETGPGHHIMSALAQTALAVGTRVGASGADVVTAVAVAYEINGRLHHGLRDGGLEEGRGMRHVPMAVALVAGKLLGLDEEQLNRALSLAWFFMPHPTAGPAFWHEQSRRRMMYHLGQCPIGIQAALLARAGFESQRDVLDLDDLYVAEKVQATPGPYHYTQRLMQLKLWQASRGLNPGLQALSELLADHPVDPDDVKELIVRAPRMYGQDPANNPSPTDYWDACQSVQWAFAMRLLGHETGVDWYTPERLADERCRAFARRVRVEEDLAAESGTVEAVMTGARQAVTDSACEVELVLADGRRLVRRRRKSETLGHPDAPISAEQLARKFLTNVTPTLGARRASELLERLAGLEREPDVRAVTRHFGPPEPRAAS